MLSFPKNVVVVQPGQGRLELSPVLTAMGIRPDVGMGAIRFSLGRDIAIEEIDAVGRSPDRRSRCGVALDG